MRSFSTNSNVRKSTRRNGRRGPLGFQRLDSRDMCAVDMHVDGSAIVVDATGEDKGVTAEFHIDDHGNNNKYDDDVVVTVTLANGQVVTESFDLYKYINSGDGLVAYPISTLHFSGTDQRDVVTNNTSIKSYLNGLGGNDLLTGGFGVDIIKGGLGSDEIHGRQGDDQLHANGTIYDDHDFVDVVYGEEGMDRIFGAWYGVNHLFGGSNWDHIVGGDRNALNFIHGGSGNDDLFGGDNGATNHIFGDAGNDDIVGGSSAFGLPKTTNILIDDEGADRFFAGNRAMNFIYAGDGSPYASQKDTIVQGEIGSWMSVNCDANDLLWDPAWGLYPNKPTK